MRARFAKFVAFIGLFFFALGGQFDIMLTQYRSNVLLDILLVAPIDKYEGGYFKYNIDI